MVTPRIRAGLFGLGLLGLAASPVAAQSWPSDSGPTGDYLGSAVRQFERLAPPPIEAAGRAERPVPNLPITDVPGGAVDVGMPVITSAPLMERSTPQPRASRRAPYRQGRATSVRTRSPDIRESRLERRIAAQERRIQELERQLQQSR
ncbi:hypothetical protein J8J14_06430 [Roseomonas sp. SSH11]|uniref:Uncharacterized protein n=1 Tax=Pararoseomonas baculiformis TaxID=2820812 RepID=A0ABS4AD23_9PROT|nr:hypothetical protein [Pararoseomonas baculiformis]MBP0444413.1 hypothetical protein [Pararoseomonas baculiformis]